MTVAGHTITQYTESLMVRLGRPLLCGDCYPVRSHRRAFLLENSMKDLKELINISEEKIGEELVPTVVARSVHEALGVRKKYADWFKNRVDEYDFKENQDFVNFSLNGEKIDRGRPTIEHHITLDMAKELAMVERTEKGRQVRKYFIECEKELKRKEPKTGAEMLLIYANEFLEMEREQARLGRKIDLLEIKTNSEQDYFTVKAYASLNGIHLDTPTANRLGRKAARISRGDNIRIGRVRDERYGMVNSYYIDILDEVFDEAGI